MSDLLDAPSLSTFVDHEDATFAIEDGDDSGVELRLTDVETTHADNGWEQFSLWFDSLDETQLSQDRYRLSNPSLDSFDVTISPTLSDGDPETPSYQAVFDRPDPDAETESTQPSRPENANPVQAIPSSTYTGEIMLSAVRWTVPGYYECDGASMAISQHQALYSILGTQFGGDGRTSFRLPDLKGRVPLHRTGRRQIGTAGGTESVVLTTDQLPAHSHQGDDLTLPVSTDTGSKDTPNGNRLAKVPTGRSDDPIYTDDATPQGSMAVSGHTATTGQNTPIQNMQPYLAMRYDICLKGVYPGHK